MRRLILAFSLMVLAVNAFAVTPARSGDRVGILVTSDHHRGRIEQSISDSLPKALLDELRRAGLDARLLTRTIEEMTPGGDSYELLVEVIFQDAEAGYSGGVSVGAPVGSVGVSVEAAMAYALADARVLLYDGLTLELMRSFDLQAKTSSPALAGVGVGGSNGFLFLDLPFLRNVQGGRVARALARSAAAQIAAR